jgi:hypothetical protein
MQEMVRTKKPRYNWNIVESGVKHHNPNPLEISTRWAIQVRVKYYSSPNYSCKSFLLILLMYKQVTAFIC